MEIFRPTPTERLIPVSHTPADLALEWIVTNGLGGYASGTITGIATRRFHGWLISALPAPYGRVMMLNQLTETFCIGSERFPLTAANLKDAMEKSEVSAYLTGFRLENGLPVFTYAGGAAGTAFRLEKRLCMVHGQNTAYITYKLLEGAGGTLEVNPGIHIRPHEGALGNQAIEDYRFTAVHQGYELNTDPGIPPLKLGWTGDGVMFQLCFDQQHDLRYVVEQERGYDWQGSLWSPGCFHVPLAANGSASLAVSTESWESMQALSPEQAFEVDAERRRRLLHAAPESARQGVEAELIFAADQFLISPVGRVADNVQAHAIGDEVRTVIAGYHWFTDWGRDTMISLEGLTLATGRTREAEYILRSFAKYIQNGLIPNMFPEGKTSGLYHTADATLWFFHAIHRYFQATHDEETLELLLPRMLDILDHHRRGTDFGIGVDPADHLLKQGADGYQLTWMDAKVGDWVVTPRRGKAVEINALWYNALRITEGWLRLSGDTARADALGQEAAQVKASFNRRFWNEKAGYCFDAVDSPEGGDGPQEDDPELRPNQLLAISLDHPVLDRARWEPVLAVSRDKLLTPVGLRSLGPDEPDYKPEYDGDLHARDAAYHQGTVWGWLIGPFFDAWLKTYPQDIDTAAGFLDGLKAHLSEAGIGTVSEIFDARRPFRPRGCIAQAWSVAELLRCSLEATRLQAEAASAEASAQVPARMG
jgi:predicted glycogen debranching enzyme